MMFFFFFQAEDGIRDYKVTGVQTCALPIYPKAQPNRTERAAGVPAHVLLANVFFFLPPLVQSLFHVLAVLNVQNARKVREAFREPLIVIALPSDALSPPLM